MTVRFLRALIWTAVITLLGCRNQVELNRKSCQYGAGDLSSKTLADYGALAGKIPIDHIVLVIQEKSVLNHYYSSLKVPGQTVDGAAPNATNPDPTKPGATISRFHQTAYCFDNPAESWDEIHRDYNLGKFDGFTTQNVSPHDPDGRRSLGYYDETDLPFYYGLARTFSISDRHFSSALTNTFTNRLFLYAGTAFGVTSDVFPPPKDEAGDPYPNLFTRLNDAGISWQIYSQDLPTPAILTATWGDNRDHFLPHEQFFTDAQAGRLPSVSLVEGSDRKGGLSPDEDPPADPQLGQAMVAGIVKAVLTSPQWSKTALFLTYDEGGGLYDHVDPPKACVPDDIAPIVPDGGAPYAFDQDGVRVPLMVVSPYAKRGHVSHQVSDHTGLLRFIEARFNLPAMTHRDANAVPPFDLFDFDHPNFDIPTLPDAPVDMVQASACAAAYP